MKTLIELYRLFVTFRKPLTRTFKRRCRYYSRETLKTIKMTLVGACLLASIGCGMSIGQSAIGTTGFLAEHNRKVKLLLLQPQAQTVEVRNEQY
jgi:hypothetical protein